MLARNTCIVLNVIVALMLGASLLLQLIYNGIDAMFQSADSADYDVINQSFAVFLTTMVLIAAPVVSIAAMLQPRWTWAKVIASGFQCLLLIVAAIALAFALHDAWLQPWLDKGNTNGNPLLAALIINGVYMATSAGTTIQVWKQPRPLSSEVSHATA